MTKWTYNDFFREITDLKARVKLLESRNIDITLTQLQHRRALSDAVVALERGLSESPVPWNAEMEKTWKEVRKSATKDLWKQMKQLPY